MRRQQHCELSVLCRVWQHSLSPALGDLGRLDGRHLLQPALGRLRLLDGAEVISRESRDAHVEVALQDELDVANLEGRGGTQLGQAAGLGDHIVDEVIGHLEHELWMEVSLCFCLELLSPRAWMSVISYLLCIGSQVLALTTAGDLADEDVKHLLAENMLAFALENVSGMLLDGWLAHHTHLVVTGATREGGA